MDGVSYVKQLLPCSGDQEVNREREVFNERISSDG
jgi:hypothetical protein